MTDLFNISPWNANIEQNLARCVPGEPTNRAPCTSPNIWVMEGEMLLKGIAFRVPKQDDVGL